MTDAPSSGWTAGDRFPTFAARDLERTARTLPAAFDAEWNLVLVAFRRHHQEIVDRWVAWQATVAADRPSLDCWEVPVLGAVWIPARGAIDGGMAQAVRESEARRHALTVYANVSKVACALDISDTSSVHAFLVDAGGTIRWRASGDPDAASTAALLAVVDSGQPQST